MNPYALYAVLKTTAFCKGYGRVVDPNPTPAVDDVMLTCGLMQNFKRNCTRADVDSGSEIVTRGKSNNSR